MTIAAADVATPEAVVDAVYRLLSGRADEPRDWDELAKLCLPGARLVPVGVIEGSVVVEVLDVAAYVRSRTPMLAAADFFESDISRRVDQRGNVAQVWSNYEARRSPHGPPFMEGVTGFQLLRTDDRWWIVSALWQAAPVTGGD